MSENLLSGTISLDFWGFELDNYILYQKKKKSANISRLVTNTFC